MAFKLVTKKLNFSVVGVEPLPAAPALPVPLPAVLEPPPELAPALVLPPAGVDPLPELPELELPPLLEPPPLALVPAALEPLPALLALPLWPAVPAPGSVGLLLPHAAIMGTTLQIKDALSKSLNIEDTSGVRAKADGTNVAKI